jgi:hypothetical protein
LGSVSTTTSKMQESSAPPLVDAYGVTKFGPARI